MSSDIRIVTDSGCDLPPDVISRLGVSVVPLTIRFGDEDYLDGDDLTSGDFWTKLSISDRLPETAAPSTGRFREVFEALALDGAEGIVAICMSSGISATYESAVLAGELVSRVVPVKVVDSQAITLALGLQVVDAAEFAREGAGLDDVAALADSNAGSSNIYAALDTLDYLKRGGRLGGTQAFLAAILNVKPLISFKNGVVQLAGRVRTRSAAMDLVERKTSFLATHAKRIGIVHSGAPDIDRLVAAAQTEPDGVIVSVVGPVVGTHTGPGAFGVAYLDD